jgi:hypothetical protein
MTEPARQPDHPRVPRLRRPAIAIAMLVFSLGVCGAYGAVAYSQREFSEPEHDEIPASVRTSPGGYRSYHFWHSGYHGGK